MNKKLMCILVFFIKLQNNKMEFQGENPLHAVGIPVADMVVVEVEGVPVLESKQLSCYEKCIKAWVYVQLCGAILAILSILSGFVLLIIWLYNPCAFGCPKNDFND